GPTRPGAPGRRGLAPLTDAESHFGPAAAGTARARNVSQSHQHHQQRISGQLTLIRTLGLLLDAAGRSGTGVSRRWNALDQGVHDVPTGAAHPDREADGAGVT